MIPKLQLCRDSSVHDRVVKEASFIPNFWSPIFDASENYSYFKALGNELSLVALVCDSSYSGG